MRDPKLIEKSEKRIPDEWRRQYLARPADRLAGDVVVLFDRWFKTERSKDEIHAQLLEAQQSLRWANFKIWVLTLVLTGEGAIIGWLVKTFLQHPTQ